MIWHQVEPNDYRSLYMAQWNEYINGFFNVLPLFCHVFMTMTQLFSRRRCRCWLSVCRGRHCGCCCCCWFGPFTSSVAQKRNIPKNEQLESQVNSSSEAHIYSLLVTLHHQRHHYYFFWYNLWIGNFKRERRVIKNWVFSLIVSSKLSISYRALSSWYCDDCSLCLQAY